MIDPQLTRMAADSELQKICKFVRVNTDDMPDWAGEAKVQTLPYVVMYNNLKAFPVPTFAMQLTMQRIKLLRHAINTIAFNKGKEFQTDPNGYVAVKEPSRS